MYVPAKRIEKHNILSEEKAVAEIIVISDFFI